MKFEISIDLGNDKMQNYDDIAGALEKTAEKIRTYDSNMMPGETGRIMDVNGNAVGRWVVKK